MPIFKNIPNVDKRYFAGNDGNIYSDMCNERKQLKVSRGNFSRGYHQLSVLTEEGIRKTISVHVLVCSAFHGEKPFEKAIVAHGKKGKDVNTPDNLRWATHSENHADKYRDNTTDKGYNNSRSDLNEAQYNEIVKLLKEDRTTHKEIASLYGVSRVTITKINTKRRYAHNNVPISAGGLQQKPYPIVEVEWLRQCIGRIYYANIACNNDAIAKVVQEVSSMYWCAEGEDMGDKWLRKENERVRLRDEHGIQ